MKEENNEIDFSKEIEYKEEVQYEVDLLELTEEVEDGTELELEEIRSDIQKEEGEDQNEVELVEITEVDGTDTKDVLDILELEEVSLTDVEGQTTERKTADADDSEDDTEEHDGVFQLVAVYGRKLMKSKYGLVAVVSAAVALAIITVTVIALSLKPKQVVEAANTAAPTVTVVETEKATQPMPLQGMKLEAVANETSITARILDESGEALAGHDFVVKLFEGSLEDNRDKVDKILQRQKEIATQVQTTQAVSSQTASVQNTVAAETDDAENEEDGSQSYTDDDKNGEVVITDLSAGTYTLLVKAEKGFEVPDATEATITKYEVIEDIMEQVVEQSDETDKEDPQADRQPEPVAPTVPIEVPTATVPAETASKKVITITTLTKNNGNIVYKPNYTDTSYSLDKIASYIKEDNKATVHLDDGTSVTGYIYETKTVTTGEGEETVITKLLVENQSTARARMISNIAPVQLTNGSTESISSASSIEANTKETTNAESTTAPKPTTTTKPTATTQPTTQPTTATPTQAPTQATVAPKPTTTTQPTTTQPTTTMKPSTATQPTTTPSTQTPTQAQKTYRIVELEALSTTETKEVFDGWYNDNGNTYFLENGRAITGWRRINALNYYFDASGRLSSTLVIDVSAYNGDINWNAVKASGINDVIVRVGYRGWGTGKIVKDKRFDQNVSGAKAAGLNVGAYFVTQAINTQEAVEEASFIISEARRWGLNLPLAIDVEWAGSGSEQGRGNYLSAGERTAVINAFCETVTGSGFTSMVYASKSWFTSYINAPAIVSYAQIWVAQYANIDATTYGGRYNMWQFRSDGAVNGISGSVDISAYIR